MNSSFNPSIAIVIPCFNRTETLSLLLSSLQLAVYHQKVDIVFSIDYSGKDEVYNMANHFEWLHGNKRIVRHEKNIGLRRNIISCGDMTTQYDAVIVLEDDLVVSPYFFDYAYHACKYYWDSESVGEISLYGYQVSEGLDYFFPLTNGYDTFFMQWASSWGQLWTCRQWSSFKKWYDNYHGDLTECHIPRHVKSWKESWKKFYIAYLVENDKYCVFPKQSFTTTRPTIGTHSTIVKTYGPSSVPLFESKVRDYLFQPYDGALRYDSFFELKEYEIELEGKKIQVDFDLFCNKEFSDFNKQYYITTVANLKGNCLKSWGRLLLPFENNVILGIEGEGLYMYKVSDYNPITLTPSEKYDRRMYLTSLESLKLLLKKMLNKIFG